MVLFYKKKRKSLLSYVNSKGIYCDSFMLKPNFFKATKGKSLDEQASLLTLLSGQVIDEKHFYFLLNLYKNDYDNFEKLMSLKDVISFSNISDDFMNACNQNKEEMDILITLSCAQHKDLLNPKIYDVYGKKVILNNLNIIDGNFEKLLPYIEVIKSNPSCYPLILQISKLNDENNKKVLMDNLDKLALVPQAMDIIDNFERFGNLQKTAILDNFDDEELIDFCLDNPSVDFGSGYYFIDDFKEYKEGIYKDVPDRVVKKLNIANLSYQDLSVERAFNSCFCNVKASLNIMAFFEEGRRKNYEPSVEAKQIELLYEKLINNSKNKEAIINIVKDCIFSSEINFDEIYKKALEWVQEFEAYKLNNVLLDPSKMKPTSFKKYTYIDENGKEVTKNIPVIVVDNPNFFVAYHNIDVKENDSLLKTPSEFINELIDNPKLFSNNKNQYDYNQNISLSCGENCINTFGLPNLLLGFSKIESRRLLMTFKKDGHTSGDKEEKLEKLKFAPAETLGKPTVYRNHPNAFEYPEIVEKRYLDGNNISFDYMMYIIDAYYKDPKKTFELTEKWAAYYDVPILVFDGPALKKKHWDRFSYLLKLYDNLDVVSFSMINEIFEERYYFNHFRDSKNTINVPSIYELTDRLFANKELNYNTAQNFVTLVDKLSLDYGWCGGCSEDEYKARRQKMQQYYNKCREVIKNSELSMSEDTYNNDKRL